MISLRETSNVVCGSDSLAIRVARLLFGQGQLDTLDSTAMAVLRQAQWTVRAVDSGQAILEQGTQAQSVSVILSGWAFRQQNLPDGKRQILDFVLAGSFLGFGSGGVCVYGVETVTPCVIASIPRRQFYALMAKVPALAIRVAEIASESELSAYANVTNLGRRSARERVAGFIVQTMRRLGFEPNGWQSCEFDLPMTQVAIADALGLSSEHVCRTLSRLTAERRIAMKGHRMTVLDPRAIMMDAGIDGTTDLTMRADQRNTMAVAA